MALVTDINFFAHETLVKLDTGEVLHVSAWKKDGKKMTLKEFRELFFLIEHKEIHTFEVDDE